MLHVTWLIIALPLIGFAVQVFLGRRLGDPLAGVVGTVFVGASFGVAIGVYLDLLTVHAPVRSFTQNLWTWIPVDNLQVHARLLIDPLSMTMVLFVTGVSSLIHLYSIGYMKGDKDFSKFFLYLNLFVVSMLILVLGSNLVVTFAGWEGVGACSYWLVAFWFEKDSAASAGKKAFIYNRIGDVGFLIAIFLVFDKLHTVEYSAIFSHLGQLGAGNTTAVCLLLLVGVAGKSAQIPLFPWLADAMEGPTPVSALIHAATMVTAGVYLLCRVNPLLHASPDAALVVAIVGAVTAFVAATIACAQQDIKKVLAYSTVSQLGYMFLAIGCGAYEAAIFLMVAHAFFKALLFLGSGSVIHGLDDEQDLKRMGDLRRYLPITFITFAVGWLAIAAVPPLSGFWAKGDILENAFVARPALWAVGLVTAALTAYYMSRLTGLAFFGSDRWSTGEDPPGRVSAMSGIPHAEHRVEHPHESPWVMTVPLWILAFFAAVAGSLAITDWPLSLARFVDPVFGANLFNDHLATSSIWILAIVDSLIALAGVGVGLRLWMTRSEHPALETAFLRFAWYINELYDAVFGRPSERLASFCADVVEPKVIDGAVNGTADLVRGAGATLRRTQTGYVRNYVLGIALGTVLVLAFMLTRLWWS
ncbi:MAG: NADH-quinone oxidoreductase subunit L [Acidimicrobiales bacterium]